MADNVVLNSGAGGVTAAADEISVGIYAQRVKPVIGADGTGVDVLPVVNGMDTAGTGTPSAGILGQFDDVATGAVTENQFAPVRISTRRALLVEGVASGTAVPVSAASLPLPTGAGTSAKQDTIIGHLDGVEGLLTTIDGDTGTLAVVGGGLEATALRVTIANDSTGVVSVDDNGGALTVDGTVTANLAAGTNNIGDVDVLSIAAGDNNIGNVDIVSLPASTNTLEVVGDVAHDIAAAGNPVGISGVSIDMDDTAPPNRVSAEARAVRMGLDRDGGLFVHPHGPQVWSYHSNGSTALTDASVHAAPGVGLSLYVTDIIVSSGAATAMNVFFEEGVTTVLGPYYLEAVAGRGVVIRFATPKKITANTALTVTTSAAIAHCVDVTGFTAQG